jgi:asparagine synthase (glutamine-hydrolysing)
MCGFFGWIRANKPFTQIELLESKNSLSSLAHRGPDNSTFWLSICGTAVFGHNRLKVIDLSESANQPMHDESKRFHLVFNGEIYNHNYLRKELEAEGQKFSTKSDTEILLYTFIKYGVPNGLNVLDGMFSGAFYDSSKKQLWIFRDHLGQKPIYYYHGKDQLVFGSELQSIINLSRFNWKISKPNFAKYLVNTYYALRDTPVENVYKLLPGTYGLFSEKGDFTTARWWDSVPTNSDNDTVSPNAAIDHFEEKFDNACILSSASDVPIGLFMSGGLDSSLIASSAKKLGLDLQILHASMADEEFDESKKAWAVAKQLGIPNIKNILMNNSQIIEDFEVLLERLDEPHGDPGLINAFSLSKEAKRDVTVVLTGDGADELLGGYLPFKALKYSPILKIIPLPTANFLINLLGYLKAGDGYLGFNFKARAFLAGAYANKDPMIHRWLASMGHKEIQTLMPSHGSNALELLNAVDVDLSRNLSKLSPVNAQLYYYQKMFLPEFVCMHTDRASMMHGLEARSPFLTKSMIEFCNQLPASLKIRGQQQKWLIMELLKRRGFKEEIYLQKKQGFTLPVARLLKTSLLKHTKDLLEPEDLFGGVICKADLKNIIEQHLSGVRNNYRILYSLIMFKAWRKKFPRVTF